MLYTAEKHPDHKVYLDGKRLHYCYAADTEKNFAYVYKTTDDDAFIFDLKTGVLEGKMLQGKVQVYAIEPF